MLGSTSYLRMPIRHGLTIGELAQLFNGERKIGAKLSVVRMPRWRRDWWFDDTGAPWINPSPNMRSLTQATLYPGIGAIEASNISVGRGTDTPFEQIGAPWIDGLALAAALNDRNIPGVRAYPVRYTPTSSVYKGEACGGVSFIVTDREAFRPTRLGLEVAAALVRLYPGEYRLKPEDRLVGSRSTTARDPRRRRSGGHRRVVGRRRGQVAPAASEVSDLHARSDDSGVVRATGSVSAHDWRSSTITSQTSGR